MKGEFLKRVLSVGLSVLMVGSTVVGMSALADNRCIVANATDVTVTISGNCGNHVTYTLDSEGTLTISGSGNMDEYDYNSSPFYGDNEIKKIIIEDGVTSIGRDAFRNCSNLTSIKIPDSVTSIGAGAFRYCTSLTSIAIPKSVTYVGSGAFYGTSWVNNQPDGLLYVGKVLYKYKGTMPERTSITLLDGVTSINDCAFSNCDGLTSITIPDSVTSIGDHAFSDCKNLTSITIPDSVTSIGGWAFNNCRSLTNIDIPSSVKNIEEGMFYYCTSLTNIKIPNRVTKIGDSAFGWCRSLTSIKIPDRVTKIGDSAFHYCSSLTSITIPDGVTSISWCAFSDCTSLESITIPDSVRRINAYAFYQCNKLTSINIPDSVTIIGKSAFEHCVSLAFMNLPNGLQSIDDNAFCACGGFASLIIPDGVMSIGDKAFYACNLTSISISDTVTKIGNSAFVNSYSLTSITIPESVTSIGDYAFGYFQGTQDGVNWIYEKNPTFIIYGVTGSAAETYANDNGFEFVAISDLKNNSTTSTEKLTLGKKLTITGAAKNGTAPYTYAYYYKRSSNTKWNVIGTEFGTATTATFKPAAAADYDIKVVVKDANGDTAEKLFKLTVTPALTNTSCVNAEKVQIGDDIRVTGGAEGGEGGYKYAFYFKRSANSKWNKIGEEFGTKTYGITVPKAAADYDMKVVVKDSKGNTAQKIFKVTVVESLPLTNISLINTPTEISVGRTVTIAGRQVGGSKPFTYEFYFKRSANSKWNKLSYGSDKHTYAKFTPTTAAEYDLKAVVIDSKGTKAEKIYKITAK